MASLSGNDISIYIRTATGPDVYKLLVCAKDSSVSESRDVIESKNKCGTTRKAGTKSWEMSFEGDYETTPTSDERSYDDMKTIYDAGTLTHFAFQDSAGTSLKLHGDGYITKLDISAPLDGIVSFSMTISGDGDLTLA